MVASQSPCHFPAEDDDRFMSPRVTPCGSPLCARLECVVRLPGCRGEFLVNTDVAASWVKSRAEASGRSGLPVAKLRNGRHSRIRKEFHRGIILASNFHAADR